MYSLDMEVLEMQNRLLYDLVKGRSVHRLEYKKQSYYDDWRRKGSVDCLSTTLSMRSVSILPIRTRAMPITRCSLQKVRA